MVPDDGTIPMKYIYIERDPPPSNIDTLLLRIPGRSAAAGEVTHKLFKDMNRKERRAFLSARSR